MSEEQTKYAVTVADDVPAIADDRLIDLANSAEKRVAAMHKIKQVALKMTNFSDWTDQNGKPYLGVSGAEKIARLFGLSWRIDEPVLEHEEGGHYSYTYKGYFSVSGVTIEAIGTRSSKDGFFKKYDWKNGSKTELPASAIDKGDVKKSAYTNLLGNGITRLLGIRNLTYQDLQEFAGITKEMVTAIEYKKTGKKQEAIQPENAESVSFLPDKVTRKEGTNKAGKAWEKFSVWQGEERYDTFSKSLAEVAKQAITDKTPVKITFKKGEYGKEIEALSVVERQPGEDDK